MDDVMRMVDQKGYAVIIAADSNAHSPLWGPDSNARGDALEDFVLAYGLRVENQGMSPTFETRRGDKNIQTHIDITLTRDLGRDLENWRVDRQYNASDHNNICFEIPTERADPQTVRPWKKADWKIFTSHLAGYDYKIPAAISMKKLDRLVTRLYAGMDTALDQACPLIPSKESVKPNHWATDDHIKLKKQVSDLYRKAKQTGTHADWAAYKERDKDFKRRCKSCLLYTSPSPRDRQKSRMPSSA